MIALFFKIHTITQIYFINKEAIMNPLDSSFQNCFNSNNEIIKKNSNIKLYNLPKDLFLEIFNYLDQINIQSAAGVSRLWKGYAIENMKDQEFFLINQFLDFLKKNPEINISQIQIKNISDLVSKIKCLNDQKFIKVKSSIIVIENKIINILKELDLNVLEKLEETFKSEKKSLYFSHLFEKAVICKQIERVHNTPQGMLKNELIENILLKMCAMKNYRMAFDFANTLTDELENSQALHQISNCLLNEGDIDWAFNTANRISSRYLSRKSYAIAMVAAQSFRFGDVDKANQIAETIPDFNEKTKLLSYMSNTPFCEIDLKDEAVIHTALNIANARPDSIQKSMHLNQIAMIVAANGNIRKAMQIADIIPNEAIKFLLHNFIHVVYIENRPLDATVRSVT